MLRDKTQSWINQVASGSLTMSQRKLEKLVKIEGDLTPVIKAARKAGIHLLKLTDDRRNRLVAASKTPFQVLC